MTENGKKFENGDSVVVKKLGLGDTDVDALFICDNEDDPTKVLVKVKGTDKIIAVSALDVMLPAAAAPAPVKKSKPAAATSADLEAAQASVGEEPPLPDVDKGDDQGLLQPVGKIGTDDGEFIVRKLDVLGRDVRRTVVEALKHLDPEGHKYYAALKYAGGKNPDLEQRKVAYAWAIRRFLDLTYRVANVM